MRSRLLTLVFALGVASWLMPQAACADMKVARINVKGMVCQA